MERKENLKVNNGVSVANSQSYQQLTKIKGILTSQIRQRDEEKEPYYYAFVKLKGHGADLPVIFKVKQKKCKVEPCLECNYPKKGNWEKQANCQTKQIEHKVEEIWIEPKLEKGNLVQLTGHYSNSDKNIRKSFTCSFYELLKDHE